MLCCNNRAHYNRRERRTEPYCSTHRHASTPQQLQHLQELQQLQQMQQLQQLQQMQQLQTDDNAGASKSAIGRTSESHERLDQNENEVKDQDQTQNQTQDQCVECFLPNRRNKRKRTSVLA